MMRATRAQLADRLAHSQGMCEAMIADCQAGRSRRSDGNLGAALQAAAGAAAEALQAAMGDADDVSSPLTSPPAPAPFGSPAAVTPNPLFEAAPEEGWEGEDELAAVLAPMEEGLPCALGTSSRHNAGQQATPSPSGSGCATPDAAAACSMRAAWQAAHVRVAEVRASCNGWDLAGFVRHLGFEVSPAGRCAWRRTEQQGGLHCQRLLAPERRACARESVCTCSLCVQACISLLPTCTRPADGQGGSGRGGHCPPGPRWV